MTSRIVVALRVPGSPERAFQVFTEETGLWWRADGFFHFTPRSPGVVAFEPPADDTPGRFLERLPTGKTFVIGEVTAWEPGRRLAFGWRQATFAPDQRTWVDVEFTPVGDETRITVQHWGWDSVPFPHLARHGLPDPRYSQRHGDWWRALLGSLGERLALGKDEA